ncbi:MAG: aminodeoxychorismate/anthranilate synthase component II [Bacteroidetes bacterium]|nr:MAG: aminodeoxychorismate/anthranilate synthase component II [Bacteroidota bacterium]
MKILLIDNYDSFTYNLFHLLEQYPNAEVEVKRSDEIDPEGLQNYNAFVLSPGPGLPSESAMLLKLTRDCINTGKVLGVCLGHQALAEVRGAKLKNLHKVHHGLSLKTNVMQGDDPLFRNIPENFMTGRYHSWVIDPTSLPEEIRIIATDDEGNVMAIKYVHKPVWGIQFHPESILTEYGKELIFNWLDA